MFKTGQRWISSAEPELGLGRVSAIEHRLVTLVFDVSQETRTYSIQQAPLTRVRFAPGDQIKTRDNISFKVESVSEKDNFLVYHGIYQGTSTAVMESDLDPDIRFNKPQDRLFTHQFDENKWFDLRYLSLVSNASLRESPYFGLFGPRISLVPHQLYIANEVAERFAPRVLLADEVGLGKTIEAGLILHKLLLTERVSRVLIIVPAALSFQWFVELIRRFNIQFVMLDEERCQQIENDNNQLSETGDLESSEFNPFDAQQLMLCDIALFLRNPERLSQVLEAEIDMLIVDEAHHLEWAPDSPSPAYLAVSSIARKVENLLLLTATPEQLGKEGHFARLRLLDPDRFHDLNLFIEEEMQYEPVARVANRTLEGDRAALEELKTFLGAGSENFSEKELLGMLIDRHGTGRILFRNHRAVIPGFPARKPVIYPLELPPEYEEAENPFFPETAYYDSSRKNWTSFDTRINWLVNLTKSLQGEKILVICGNTLTAIQLEDHLSRSSSTRTTVFHEEMDLIARDRSATYFSQTDKGAQIMIASEIGSEGRNFQFAHHLVLFDLPLSPDLIEQRIGRLDRIGQASEVYIHIPYFKNSLQESVLRLFHEGLDMFSAPNSVAQTVFEEILELFGEEPIDNLVAKCKKINQIREEAVSKGKDRLLELQSNNTVIANKIVTEISRMDADAALHNYMEKNFEAWGLESEYLGENIYHLKPTDAMSRHESVSIETQGRYRYPELPDEGLSFTYDRRVALGREDVLFLTWESPIVSQAMDLLISDITGNNCVIVIKKAGFKPGTLLIEPLYIVESVSPAKWNIHRYLPSRVIRVLLDNSGNNLTEDYPYLSYEEDIQNFPRDTIIKIVDSQSDRIKELIELSEIIARDNLESVRDQAIITMTSELNEEIQRLSSLRNVNPNIRVEELQLLTDRKSVLTDTIKASTIRLDSIRVIVTA